MSVRLFLDDKRTPKKQLNFTVVRSYDEFVDYIYNNPLPAIISFDHDLADEHYADYLSDQNFEKDDKDVTLKYDEYKERTGLHAAQFLVNWCINNELQLPKCYVHSQNPVGAENIIAYLNRYLEFIAREHDELRYAKRWDFHVQKDSDDN